MNTQLTTYLEILSHGFAWLTIFILFLIVAWTVSLNTARKFTLAVVYIVAVFMTFYAVTEMATLSSCQGHLMYADAVKCFSILLPPWVIVCVVHVWTNGKVKPV